MPIELPNGCIRLLDAGNIAIRIAAPEGSHQLLGARGRRVVAPTC